MEKGDVDQRVPVFQILPHPLSSRELSGQAAEIFVACALLLPGPRPLSAGRRVLLTR
jgi:hypothetical protein